jgi:thioredoxin 2
MTTTADLNKKPVLIRCRSCSTMNRVDVTRAEQGPKCAKCGAALSLNTPQSVTDADFQRIIEGSSVPVVVDFYADWCGPCRAMAPALDAFASANAGKALVLKLDTDVNPLTSSRFGIRSIPTIISFQAGKELRRHVGAASRGTLEGLVGD